MVELCLPWPPSVLFPNRTVNTHWRKKGEVAKRYRFDCYILTKQAVQGDKIFVGFISLDILFNPPDKRSRDLDGCFSAIKHALDGVADSLGVNDKLFRPIKIDFGDVVKHGQVLVRL